MGVAWCSLPFLPIHDTPFLLHPLYLPETSRRQWSKLDLYRSCVTIVQILYLDSPAMDNQDLYRIGTVASLTGISVERLRAWERRYDLSPAHKAGKTRFYSRSQLDRLKLIKHLIDRGQPISSLASLNTEQLLARIDEDEAPGRQIEVAHRPRVGLIGPNLLTLEHQAGQQPRDLRLDVIARWANMDAFMAEQGGVEEPQVVILQNPVLSQQPIDLITEVFPNTRIVAIYQFASANTVSAIQNDGTPTLKWPVGWSEIEHTAIVELGLPGKATSTVPRRFSDEELIAIAAETEDPTNCVQYLIEAVHQLNGFNLYADDAAHAADWAGPYTQLGIEASQARHVLENALADFLAEQSGSEQNLYKI